MTVHGEHCKCLFDYEGLFSLSVPPRASAFSGVPGRPGPSHGAGRAQSQAGPVDQRLPGRTGERDGILFIQPLKKSVKLFQTQVCI